MEKEYITPLEASKIFSIDYQLIYRWIKIEKVLPFYQISERKILLKKIEVEAFIQSKKVDFQKMKNDILNT